MTVPVRADTRLIEVVRALDAAGVDAIDVHRRVATLDDVLPNDDPAPRHEDSQRAVEPTFQAGKRPGATPKWPSASWELSDAW